jgi:hypothetical protein
VSPFPGHQASPQHNNGGVATIFNDKFGGVAPQMVCHCCRLQAQCHPSRATTPPLAVLTSSRGQHHQEAQQQQARQERIGRRSSTGWQQQQQGQACTSVRSRTLLCTLGCGQRLAMASAACTLAGAAAPLLSRHTYGHCVHQAASPCKHLFVLLTHLPCVLLLCCRRSCCTIFRPPGLSWQCRICQGAHTARRRSKRNCG